MKTDYSLTGRAFHGLSRRIVSRLGDSHTRSVARVKLVEMTLTVATSSSLRHSRGSRSARQKGGAG
jgi:hypothetical protein